MIKILLLLSIFSSIAHANMLEWEQYPEEREYTSSDRGMRAYRALSLYKSGTFTLTLMMGLILLARAKCLMF